MSTISDRWPLKIDGRGYVTELGLVDRQRLGSLIQATDASQEPSDRSISNDGLWRRTRSNFEEGTGQEWVDLTEESIDSNPLRFWWSRGVDVLTRPGVAFVLPGTTQQATVGNGDTGRAVQHLGYVYVASGAAVERSASGNLSSWSDCTGEPGGTITDMVRLGSAVYVCDGAGVSVASAGGLAFSSFSTEDTDYMVAGSGRLIGMHDNDVWEFTNAGAKLGGSDIHSHFDTAFAWKGGVAAPNGVYIFGDGGDGSEIYLLAPTDATGEFAAPYPVGELEDEVINRMEFYGGFIIMATSKGVRLAQIGGSGFLSYGPLIEIGDVLDLYKAPEGFVYFTWSVFNDVDGSQLDSGVGRLALDRFSQPLVPAYQSDIMAGSTGTVRCVSGLDGRVLFGVDDGSSLDVYVADTSGVTTGYLRPGKIVYGSAEIKSLTSFEVKTSDLVGTVAVTIDGDGETIDLDSDETTRQRRYAPVDSASAEVFDPLITLTSFTGDLERWTIRGLPLLRRASVWTFPVKLAEQTSGHGKVRDRLNPLSEFAFLNQLASDAVLVDVEFGDYQFTGYVDDVLLAQNASTRMLEDWGNADGDIFPSGTWLIRVIENADS